MSPQCNQHIEVVNDCVVAPLKKFSKMIPNEAKESMKARDNVASKYSSARVRYTLTYNSLDCSSICYLIAFFCFDLLGGLF